MINTELGLELGDGEGEREEKKSLYENKKNLSHHHNHHDHTFLSPHTAPDHQNRRQRRILCFRCDWRTVPVRHGVRCMQEAMGEGRRAEGEGHLRLECARSKHERRASHYDEDCDPSRRLPPRPRTKDRLASWLARCRSGLTSYPRLETSHPNTTAAVWKRLLSFVPSFCLSTFSSFFRFSVPRRGQLSERAHASPPQIPHHQSLVTICRMP